MDPISDMLNRITNAQAVNHAEVMVPFSKLKMQIAQLLAKAGYLDDVQRQKRKTKKSELDWLELKLKYDGRRGVISGIRVMSHPSRHLYIKAKDLRPVRSGYGLAIISTPQGVMTNKEARKANLGGEMMFEIW